MRFWCGCGCCWCEGVGGTDKRAVLVDDLLAVCLSCTSCVKLLVLLLSPPCLIYCIFCCSCIASAAASTATAPSSSPSNRSRAAGSTRHPLCSARCRCRRCGDPSSPRSRGQSSSGGWWGGGEALSSCGAAGRLEATQTVALTKS